MKPCRESVAAALRGPYKQILVWDVATRKELARIDNVPGIAWYHSLAFSHDVKRLGCGQRDTTVLIWNWRRFARDADADGIETEQRQ